MASSPGFNVGVVDAVRRNRIAWRSSRGIGDILLAGAVFAVGDGSVGGDAAVDSMPHAKTAGLGGGVPVG